MNSYEPDTVWLQGFGVLWNNGEVVTIDFNSGAGTEIKLVHKDSGTPIVFDLE
ncbi:MAG: hypothetical protein U9N35_00855 [Euryarchaeota archaeon]|nr:hypothetical protein [Euryarchaeota archaeon]